MSNRDTASLKQIPVGYFRTITYHPIVPVAAARSYDPYQGTGKYVNDPMPWARLTMPYEMRQQFFPTVNRGPLPISAAQVAPSNQINSQNQISSLHSSIDEVAVPKTPVVSTTQTPITTKSTEAQPITIETIARIDTGNELSSSAPTVASPTTASSLNPQAQAQNYMPNSVPSTPPHVQLPHYSQPIPEHLQMPQAPYPVPYVSSYNPQVQYMPCMCPVSVGIPTDVMPNKQFESREGEYDTSIDMSAD